MACFKDDTAYEDEAIIRLLEVPGCSLAWIAYKYNLGGQD